MIRLKLLGILALICALGALGTNCSPGARTADTTGSKPVVTITYNAAFNGETASGYLNLVVDMTIENTGYESFDMTPSSFLVKVGEYSYKARESQLETVDLPDGAKTQGKLKFQVPPQAALPHTGYEIAYSGQVPHNIVWISSPDTAISAPISRVSSPLISIDYSTNLMWLSPPGTQYLKVEPPGNLYLVVEMSIENKGYESFHTNPDNFSIELSSLVDSATAGVEEELIDWREIDIPNSGRYTGVLVFHVPTVVAQSFYRWDYKMVHSGVRSYNIQWTEVHVVKYIIDAVESDLEGVNLPDGGSIEGRLAFSITPELASDNVSYEMVYDKETFHNVQWFDSPNAVADVNRNPIAYPVIKITYSTDLVQREDSGRLYLIVDVLIENKGYDYFYTSPANFFVEVSY